MGSPENGTPGQKNSFWVGQNDYFTSKTLDLEVAPNPVKDVLNVTITTKDKNLKGKLTLSSIMGTGLKSYEVNDMKQLKISFSDLPSGVYLLHFSDEKGQSVQKRIIH
jgi:hypothetical protein